MREIAAAFKTGLPASQGQGINAEQGEERQCRSSQELTDPQVTYAIRGDNAPISLKALRVGIQAVVASPYRLIDILCLSEARSG